MSSQIKVFQSASDFEHWVKLNSDNNVAIKISNLETFNNSLIVTYEKTLSERYIFRDLQALGGYSAHTTIEGLSRMLSDDWLAVVEQDGDIEELKSEKRRWENPSVFDMVNIIRDHDYEILPATPENIKKYENYHDVVFNK